MPSDIKNILDDVRLITARVSSECAKIFFEKRVGIKEEWAIVESLHCDTDPVLMIGCSNNIFLSVTLVSMPIASLAQLLGRSTIPYALALDVLGEFSNQYCGLILHEPEFQNIFGIMTQSVPALLSNSQWILPFLGGIEGKLSIDDMPLYMGFMIREGTFSTEPKSWQTAQ